MLRRLRGAYVARYLLRSGNVRVLRRNACAGELGHAACLSAHISASRSHDPLVAPVSEGGDPRLYHLSVTQIQASRTCAHACVYRALICDCVRGACI